MHDSLLSRFRGAYLGALLGALLGASLGEQNGAWIQIKKPDIDLSQSELNPFGKAASWGQQLLSQTAVLTGTNLSNPDLSNPDLSSSKLSNPNPLNPTQPNSDRQAGQISPTLLPLALLHHDQPQTLQQVLQQFGSVDANRMLEAVVLGQVFSLILRERFASQSLIPQVIRDLDLSTDLPMTTLLSEVQTWLEQSADLATVTHTVAQKLKLVPLADLSISLLLYSFLSTPNHFQLSLLRLLKIVSDLPNASLGHSLSPSLDPSLSATLGAMSGLYNGLLGLPLGWRQQFWANEFWANEFWANESQVSSHQREITSEQGLFQQTDRLLALWSGDLTSSTLRHSYSNITAAPRVIRAFEI
jgi:hypothetical protein